MPRKIEFQRRHFEWMADILKQEIEAAHTPVRKKTAKQIAAHFAGRCRMTNPHFCRDRFLTACGFFDDERGSVTVDMALWLAFLTMAGTVVGSAIVTPLVDLGQAQAALNAQSVQLIEDARNACGGS